MVSSIGATAMPQPASTCMSNLMLWPILRTAGSSSSGFSRRAISALGSSRGPPPRARRRQIEAALGGRRRCAAPGYSRPCPARRDSDTPTRSQRSGSSELVSVSTATSPARLAAATQPVERALRSAPARSRLVGCGGGGRLRASVAPAASPSLGLERGRCEAAESLHRRGRRASASRSGSRTREAIERLGHRHVVARRTSCLRNPGRLGIGEQASRRFGCLISPARASRVSRSPNSVDQLRRGLDADARHARHVVGGIAGQRLHVDHLVGRDAEFLEHLGRADRPILHRIEHCDAVADQLHQILVRRDDGDLGAPGRGLPGIGGDQVVGLEAGAFRSQATLKARTASRISANCGTSSSGGSGRWALYSG